MTPRLPLRRGPRALTIVLAAFLVRCPASPAAEQPDAALHFAHAQQARLQSALELEPPAQTEALLKEVRRTFDFPFFAEQSLGPRWPGLTAAQREGFRRVLQELIEQWYLKQTAAIFSKGGATFEMASPSAGGVDVSGRVRRGESTLGVVMRLHERGGSWLVYDIVVDELSFLESYREQFLRFLEGKDADSLIAQLRAKADAASPRERDDMHRRQSTKDR